MSKRNAKLFIQDILEAIEKIENYVAGTDFESFKKDSKTVDAVIRNLEIIGEAARNIPEGMKRKYGDIPWRDLVDFRNRITHEYFGISLTIVWHIIKQELPQLEKRMKQILEEVRE